VNALHLAQKAYSSATAPIRTPQSNEYQLISTITARLKTTARSRASGFASFVAALHENRRLWVMLAGNVADADNALPETLRARLLYLAEFTFQHTGQVLNGTAEADVLIDINTAVMRGLRQQATVS